MHSAVLCWGYQHYREGLTLETTMKTIALIALVAACGTTESSSLLTTGIAADMSAVTTGDGTTRVTAELFNGSPDQLIFVELEPGDQLLADTGGQLMPLTETQLVTIISYDATFATANPGDLITITFQRMIDDGAPTSTVTLPAPFTIDPIAASSSRAAALTITYAPSGTPDPVGWQASGDCIAVATGAAASDSGSITIPAGTLTANSGSTSCVVTVSLTRERAGELDAHFGKGGEIQGQQVRTAMTMSTP
jgi:hypothetical protein